MNATLQCMAHFIEISEDILTWYTITNDSNKKQREISYAYAEVLNNLFFPKENQKDYSPNNFKHIISLKNDLFKGIQANDSKDVYLFLIESMHKELNDLNATNNRNNNNFNFEENVDIDQRKEVEIFQFFKKNTEKTLHSIISKYLYSIQKTISECDRCHTMIYNFLIYNLLIFPLLEVKNYVIIQNYQNQFYNPNNHIITIYDCFKYFQRIEHFSGQNRMHCKYCNSEQCAKYCNLLYSSPIILSIMINRGKNNEDFNEPFIFHTELDLSDYVEENKNSAKYYLIGVICHVGESSMNGHFFAYCRSVKNSPWYIYNDNFVTQCDENRILKENTPYLLFYHKYE
jgi:ubiquitin C-terminal hydrolase